VNREPQVRNGVLFEALTPVQRIFRRMSSLFKWSGRDYQELKQELGLGHYEGSDWRGFHHHATCSGHQWQTLYYATEIEFNLERPLKTLERVFSKAGIGSRTEARSWIEKGRVPVNGRIVRKPNHWLDLETDRRRKDAKRNPHDRHAGHPRQ